MSVVDLDEVKVHLNITGDAQTAELQATLDAAESAIAKRVGPLEPGAVTERVVGGGCSLTLSTLPVVSLTSVADQYGNAVDVSTLVVSAGGVVEWADGWGEFLGRRYTVTYQAGWSPLPADLVLAVKEMVRHLWVSQRGAGVRPGSPPSSELSNTLPGAAFALPIRVAQIIQRYEQPGFA